MSRNVFFFPILRPGRDLKSLCDLPLLVGNSRTPCSALSAMRCPSLKASIIEDPRAENDSLVTRYRLAR